MYDLHMSNIVGHSTASIAATEAEQSKFLALSVPVQAGTLRGVDWGV